MTAACNEQAQPLLAPLPPEEFHEYHQDLLDHTACCTPLGAASKLEVRPDAGEGKGKGLFAVQPLTDEALLFRELPLVRSLLHLALGAPPDVFISLHQHATWLLIKNMHPDYHSAYNRLRRTHTASYCKQ